MFDLDDDLIDLQIDEEREILNALVSDIINGTFLTCTECLSDSIYIGPLRKIPGRDYKPPAIENKSRWPSGLAAWDNLFMDQPWSKIFLIIQTTGFHKN